MCPLLWLMLMFFFLFFYLIYLVILYFEFFLYPKCNIVCNSLNFNFFFY